MKGTPDQLIKRGFLAKGEELQFLDLSFHEKIVLLKSNTPEKRTLAARLLANQSKSDAIEYLINALKLETKLYPKLEICNSLVNYKQHAVKPLVKILGEIGNNQHKTVPGKDFKKSSYPLPRDIASRTLARIGENALAELSIVIASGNMNQISEAVDAIGYVCYYSYNSEFFVKLKDCYLKNNGSDLIRWKIIRAMSGFPESLTFLGEEYQKIQNDKFKKEIKRSLLLIKTRLEI